MALRRTASRIGTAPDNRSGPRPCHPALSIHQPPAVAPFAGLLLERINPMASLFRTRLARPLRAFRHASHGNVAIMFAIAIVPIIGLVGAAVDYSRANSARSALQSALDATALMISREAAGLSEQQIAERAQAYFESLYNHPDGSISPLDVNYTPNTGNGASVSISANGSIQTTFMKMAGFPTISFPSSTSTKWGASRMRVALALDITGSMVQGSSNPTKLDAMKEAAKDLVDTLKGSATATGDIYISIVPFNVMVNVGADKYEESWLRWDDWDNNNGSCSGGSSYKTRSACTSVNVCSNSRYTKKRDCERNNGTWGNANYTWTPRNHSTWNGCVQDRDQNYDTTRHAPSTDIQGTLFPVPSSNYSDCRSENSILPLISAYGSNESDESVDGATLKGKINTLVARGGTNQAIGMHWAWMSLQQTDPLNAPAFENNYQYTNVIILLSDGENTKNRWSGNGSSWSEAVDDRQKLLCDNVKATDPETGKPAAEIYTIQVGTMESDVLQYCASSPSHAFTTTTAEGIGSAFNQIASQLSMLRLTH
ncbi:MAG: pilus assembly protein [Xanthobacteraceae bacterium]